MGDAHAHMQEHEHGKMDIRVQERTFDGFITAMKWGVGVSLGILVFLAVFNS